MINRMLSSVARFFRLIAATDEDVIGDCPKADQIWAVHIGCMLCLTFVVLFVITYLSFDYIGATSMSFDETTNKISFGKVNRNWQTISIGMILALVIALIVTLFDRAIYQSDWFYQKDYTADGRADPFPTFAVVVVAYLLAVICLFLSDILRVNFLNHLQSAFDPGDPDFLLSALLTALITLLPLILALGISSYFDWLTAESGVPQVTFGHKIWRIGIRLLISVCVAIALSTFLELKLYELSIVSMLKEEYANENRPIYEKYNSEIDALDRNIEELQEDVKTARDRLKRLQEGRGINDNTLQISELRESAYERLDIELNRQLKPHQARLDGYEKKQRELREEYDDYRAKAKAEEFGNPENLAGISRFRGCGERCRYYQEQADIRKESMSENESNIKDTKAQMKTIRDDFNNRRREKRAAYDNQKNTSLSEIETEQHIIMEAKTDVQNANKLLREARKNKPEQRKRLKEEIQENPDYKPFQAGPVARLRAFSILKKDEKYGATILIYSLWLKVFVVFLEVIPVITKIFFSPPSVYGMKLRYAVYKATLAESRAGAVENEVTNGYNQTISKVSSEM